MLRATDGSMWVATAEGLVHVVATPAGEWRVARYYTSRDGLRSNSLSSVTQARDGTIWVGTLGGGVSRLDPDGVFRSLGAAEGLADNNVYDVRTDREGNVWVATVDGLTRLSPPTIEPFRASGAWTTSTVWSADAHADGTVWVGTGSDGLIRVDREGRTRMYGLADGLGSTVVLTSLQRRDGTRLFGTRQGLVRLDGDRFTDLHTPYGVPNTGVRSLFEDARGDLWIGSDSALIVVGSTGRRIIQRVQGDQPRRIYSITADARGRTFVAGGDLRIAGGDLRIAVGDSLPRFVAAGGATVRESMDLRVDGDDVWIASYITGLALLRGDVLTRFPPERTGVFAEILQIVDDGRGALWLTSSTGLQRVFKRDLFAWMRDSTQRPRIRQFTRADGLRSHDFAKSGSRSGTRGPDGRLWLPTSAGLVVIEPAAIQVDTVVPHVYIERVTADEVPLGDSSTITLPRGTRRVRILFTTTTLAASSRARLWYRLDGVDPDWRVADPLLRTAEYESLPRGTFTFRVRAENADGIPSEHDAVRRLVSRPPLSDYPLFWILLAMLAGIAGIGAFRWRVGQLRARSATLQQLLDDRTEALAERRRMEQQMLHAQKLESVGRLAGGVAHDLNNLLTAVYGNVEYTLAHSTLDDATRDNLAEVLDATERSTHLTRQLLTFARKQVVEPRIVRLGALLQTVTPLVRRLLTQSVQLDIRLDEGDWTIRADQNQLEQVILNLTANSRDAMPKGGTLTFRTSAVTLDSAFCDAHPSVSAGEYVMLEVTDTGVGMSSAVLAHVFEPFFTTKEPGHGTGLGLASVYGIVTQSGGHVMVESEEGVGTTFRIYLPRAHGAPEDASAPAPAAPAAAQAMPRGTERLLLVEDELAVRTIAERTLRSLGYDVIAAVDGQEAIERLESARGAVSLVLTDMRMPRLGGADLAVIVRERWPHVRLIFMSGNAEPQFEGGELGAGTILLRKPFSGTQLATAIRDELDRP
jgi:signal transduction histidine kinase/streptogramin lyase